MRPQCGGCGRTRACRCRKPRARLPFTRSFPHSRHTTAASGSCAIKTCSFFRHFTSLKSNSLVVINVTINVYSPSWRLTTSTACMRECIMPWRRGMHSVPTSQHNWTCQNNNARKKIPIHAANQPQIRHLWGSRANCGDSERTLVAGQADLDEGSSRQMQRRRWRWTLTAQ